MAGKKDFPEDVKLKCLLWSDRHCCLCGKACGTDIEIAHVDSRGGIGIENAIPLCYDCHARIGHYNKFHPRGNKYKSKELVSRRDQIYDTYTSHLVPPINFGITQKLSVGERKLPDVGFFIHHLWGSYPVKVRVEARVTLGEGAKKRKGHQ